MTLKPVALVVLLGTVGGLAGLERTPKPEERLALLTPEAAGAVQGGQMFCYDRCVSPHQCVGGQDDACSDHICDGPGQCPADLIVAEHYVNAGKQWCDGCAFVSVGLSGCTQVGNPFCCEEDELCMGACIFYNGALRCPQGGTTCVGGWHQDYVPWGNNCIANP